jgi:hypothetical protein
VFDEKFVGLERSFTKEKKGEERGGPGPFIGKGWRAGGGRVSEEGAMDGQEGVGRGQDSSRGRGGSLPVGPVCQRSEELGRIPFEVETVLGRGCFGGWADLVPLGPFHVFFSFSSFSFSVFLFLL